MKKQFLEEFLGEKKINKDFGINLFSFLQLFHWYTLLYGIVIYIIALGGLSLIIVKLGIDVSKRIEEFKDLIDGYTEELSATIDVS